MKFPRKGILTLAAMSSLLLSLNAHADWAESTDPLVIKPNPSNSQVQPQNPPGFTWARHPTGPAAYEIEITPVGGNPVRTVVDRNWYLPSRALAQGNYTWRVRPANSSDWSTPRAFSITSRSVVFEVPDNATLRARIAAKGHPRSLPASFTPYASWNAAKRNDLESYASRLGNEVKNQAAVLMNLSDSTWPIVITSPLTAAMSAQQSDVRRRINEASRQLEAAAFMWRLKKDPIFFNEAIKRGDQLAGLNPSGPTSFTNQDQATRQIAVSLIKAVDMLAGDLDSARRARWLDNVKVRTNEIYANLAGDNGRLDQFPFDAHANTSMVFVALISTLALGDIPDAQKWFDFSFRAYANSPSPWSGPEGGFANGSAYAEYLAGYLVALWDPLSAASGVNYFDKPWSRGLLDFATQFVPPGSPKHTFGDASETTPDPRVWRAFASRMWSPRAAWYYANLTGLEDPLSLLQAPYPLTVVQQTWKEAPSNSSFFPSTGWVSMHSDLGNPQRQSFYFKSSPYGSFNHSHGDQNGMLLSVAGQPLLVKAGWYDWYGSPYWTDWYHTTRSQNAITFDGGKGQLVNGYRETLLRNGKINAFGANLNWDYVDGDATAAYGGQLTLARRQVWHLRKAGNALLVRDRLSATAAHTYEFNLHTPAPMTIESPTAMKVAVNGQSLCVRSLNTNASFARWSGPAPKAGVVEDHGAFYMQGPANATNEFLILMDVGCKRPSVTFSRLSNGVRTVTVAGQTIDLY